MENDQKTDPYEVVLADLRAQRERIDTTITLLESLRSGGVAVPVSHVSGTPTQPKKGDNRPDVGPGAYLGMSIPDAARKTLHVHHRQMATAEITAELERGGLVMKAANKVNNVGSILLRRFSEVGDIVRVDRGIWGLQEWYPGRKFPSARAKAENGEKPEEQISTESSVAENGSETEPTNPTGAPASWMDKVGDRLQEEGDV